MRFLSLAVVASLLSGVAVAALAAPPTAAAVRASRPLIAPPAPWVLPAAIPPAPSASEGAATVTLLNDSQMRFTADGDTYYFAGIYRIATSKGLDDAALQVSWDPALDTLTLHHYRILRDGKTIDLLGDGSGVSVVQREKNMESAALDGRLTALVQPEDVRVGDVVDMAYSLTTHDPAMGGRSEQLSGPGDGAAFGRYRMRMLWPTTKAMKWRAFPGVLQPKLIKTAAGNELVADMSDVVTGRPPQKAPSRFTVINAVEISEFPSWAAVSAALDPLYEKAAKLAPGSPVQTEAARIAAATSDPLRRTELALQLVEEKVRYLYLGMNDGGYIPAAADLTWARRFGDCKGKTVLLTALLRELGIDARPVLVNTSSGDLVATRLPMMRAFDHVIVQARIGGKSYWLDGTRLGDTSLSRLRTPAYRAGLPLVHGGTDLVPMVPEDEPVPTETVSLALDASGGIDVPAKAVGEMRYRGMLATDMRIKYAGYSTADRDVELRKMWRKTYDIVTPETVGESIDAKTGDYLLTMRGTAKMDWFADAGTRWFELDRARLGWKFDTVRDGALNKDAPFAIDYPDYYESRETIKLPDGGREFRLQGESVDQTVAGIYAFHRKLAIDGDTVSVEASTRALANELPAAKAEDARTDMAKLAAVGLFVRLPETYVVTDGDIAAIKDEKARAAAYLKRGTYRFDRHEQAGARADAEAAVKLDPTLAGAHGLLALSLANAQDPAAAAVADKALALDAKQLLAWRAKSIDAFRRKQYAEAEKDADALLALAPKDGAGLMLRGGARLAAGRRAEAMSDIDAAIAIEPSANFRRARAAVLAEAGQAAEALAEADRAVGADPADVPARLLRANLRQDAKQLPGAIADYDRVIAVEPTPLHYLQRASAWQALDKTKAQGDIASALKVDPRSVLALAARASTAMEDGRYASTEADIASIDKIEPGNRSAASLRVRLLDRQGRHAEALRQADANVTKLHDAAAYNERCWLKATRNMGLESALADCEAALKLSPTNAAALDSRGFTKLRLGSLDGAITDYDAALKAYPRLPASLFGRAVAYARKGERAKALGDLATARSFDGEIEKRFAEYGVTLPADYAGPAAK